MIGISTDRFALDGVRAPDAIDGTPGDDRIDGTDGADSINGLGGDDLIQGLGGNDLLLGGAGDDTLLGGSGRDTLEGGGGNNELDGGSGADLIRIHDLITLRNLTENHVDGGSGIDVVAFVGMKAGVTWDLSDPFDYQGMDSVEGFIGTRFDDEFVGTAGRNLFNGAGGDDLLEAARNQFPGPWEGDKLKGGAGDDGLIGAGAGDLLKGGPGNDGISGETYDGNQDTDSADTMSGGAGDDSLYLRGGDLADGGDGKDLLLIGGDGDNTLTGGADADTFLFQPQLYGDTLGVNLITDLAPEDKIDLSPIDADATQSGNQAFTLVSSLDGHAGEAALVYDAGADETALLLDTDGDGAANITIRLSGDQTGFTNFVL